MNASSVISCAVVSKNGDALLPYLEALSCHTSTFGALEVVRWRVLDANGSNDLISSSEFVPLNSDLVTANPSWRAVTIL